MRLKLLVSIITFTFLCTAILNVVFSQTTISNVKVSDTKTVNKSYVGNKIPLTPLHFIKSPVGSIKPQGWILKYLELQRDGLTGQLGEISAWLDKSDNAWYSGNGKGGSGWEEVPYWLKGYGNLGYILKDEKIIAETRLWLDKIFESNARWIFWS